MPETRDATDLQLRLGTRSSALALWQAHWVADRLREIGVAVQIVSITTTGDVRRDPISQSGTQGVFTKEIQRALLEDRIDLAVHSLKDLPTEAIDGLHLAAVPTRASAGDVLVSNDSLSLDRLPPTSRVGTGSIRRQAQLLAVRSDLEVCDIRGNVDTRLEKLQRGEYDAIVLAEAGLRRLGLEQHIAHVIPFEIMLPAVGQGALGIETRADDAATQSALMPLDDPPTHHAVRAERALLATLRGGCLAPVGAWARIDGGSLHLDAVVLSPDGQSRLTSHVSGDEAVSVGQTAAQQLLEQGAGELIALSRERE